MTIRKVRIPFQGITFPFAVPWHLFCDNIGTVQVNECQSFSRSKDSKMTSTVHSHDCCLKVDTKIRRSQHAVLVCIACALSLFLRLCCFCQADDKPWKLPYYINTSVSLGFLPLRKSIYFYVKSISQSEIRISSLNFNHLSCLLYFEHKILDIFNICIYFLLYFVELWVFTGVF